MNKKDNWKILPGKPTVKDIMENLGEQVSGPVEEKEPEPVKNKKHLPTGRRDKVRNLYRKGYTMQAIAQKLNISTEAVTVDINSVEKLDEGRKPRSIEYRRKQQRERLSMVAKEAWELADTTKNDNTKLGSLRVVLAQEDLRAKVDGIIAEKSPGDIEKKSDALLKQLYTLAKGHDGNGKKDVEVNEVATPD